MLLDNRYELQDKLGQGGMGAVYRAKDRLSGQFVALKQVLISETQLGFTTNAETGKTERLRIALADEFRTLSTLRHPHIISVLDYGFDDKQQPFFTMELLENPRTLTQAAMSLQNNERLELILQVLEALRYLHHRRILHRDLKPGNILVTTDNLVKVVDFGLAVLQERAEGFAGTIGYMAPEVFSHKQLSPASDLFAVGVIMYQLLDGELPFPAKSLMMYISSIQTDTPDLSHLDDANTEIPLREITNDVQDTAAPGNLEGKTALLHEDFNASEEARDNKTFINEEADSPTAIIRNDPIPAANDFPETQAEKKIQPWQFEKSFQGHRQEYGPLASLIGALIKVDPEERISSAGEVKRQLQIYLRIPQQAETREIQESYLTTAPLVGRDAELERLHACIDAALQGEESMCLVGGESGAGKSRLLEEVRTYALVKGVKVLKGQAVDNQGLPFQLWRELLRHLVLQVEPQPLEASVLKEIVPDIQQLIGSPVDDIAKLSSKAHQDRLVLTIVELFKRIEHPTLLVLEDLQWSHEDLLPLKQLLKVRDHLSSLAVIATYRDDERSDLPRILNGMDVLTLFRLGHEHIAELSQAMLGDAGQNPQLIELLETQTEGNTLFMVEVVRALAEETGHLGQIGTMELPQEILTGGMHRLLNRRINQIPEIYQSLLQYAALIGRQVDTALLSYILPDHDIDEWLCQPETAAVFMIEDDKWQFSHAKLREAVLQDIPDDEKPSLHYKVATAVEALYPDNEDYNAVLLEHWHHAGIPDKELQYLAPVAKNLIEISNDYTGALELLERGHRALPHKNDVRMIEIGNLEAHAHYLQGNYDRAEMLARQSWDRARVADNQAGIARSLQTLGSVALRQSNYRDADKYYQQSLSIFETINDQAGISNCLNNLGIVAGAIGDLTLAQDYYQRSLTIKQSIGEQFRIATTLMNMGTVARDLGNYEQAVDYHQQSLAISQSIGEQSGIAHSLNNLAVVFSDQQDYARARGCFEQSLEIRQTIGDQFGTAVSLFNLGDIACRQKDFLKAQDYYQQSLEISETIGDDFGVALCLSCLSDVAGERKNYVLALELLSEALSVARDNDLVLPTLISIMVLAGLLLKQGHAFRAAELVGLVQHHPAHNMDTEILVRELQPTLEDALSQDKLQQALELGKHLNLEDVVQEFTTQNNEDLMGHSE